MIVDANKISFKIHDAFSLKDKRRVLKSMLTKLSNKYPVSVSEVADHDILNKGVIGVAIVSNNAIHNTRILNSVVEFMLSNYEIDIISVESYN